MKRILFLLFSLVFTLPLYAANRYIVTFEHLDRGSDEGVHRAGGEVIHRLERYRALAVSLTPQQAEAMRKSPGVKAVEIDPERHLMSQTIPYGIPLVQADLVSDANVGNRKVCIIDSGYYKPHKDLQNVNVTGEESNNLREPLKDGCGHGSHVAGIISAVNNARGVVGVMNNKDIHLHIVKMFNDKCEAGFASDLIAAVNSCVQEGANVINMSLGGGGANTIERQAMEDAYAAGVLLVASAGNDGTHDLSYPASYGVVMSIGAIDQNEKVADFSQKNNKVSLVAPGVGVLSTVPFKETNTLKAGGVLYQGNWIENAKRTTVSGTLIDGGICDTSSTVWSGKVVLCERGIATFNDKVKNVQQAGGIAAVIYNNASGGCFGTLGEGNSSTIPAISLDQESGQFLVNNEIGASGTVVSTFKKPASGYASWDGTSFSAPHVSGIAALIWSYNPNWTNANIRTALEKSAKDLGKKGKDKKYGHGLVQAQAALEWLQTNIGP